MANLEQSLTEFGYVDPMIWNEATGFIVGGNQRLLALRKLGWNEVDVLVVHLSLDREKLLNIALNRISGDWDNEKLRLLLVELQEAEANLALSGFDKREIEVLLSSLENFNPVEAWKAMPEYKSQDLSGRTITMHFKTEKDVQDFAKLIDQKITERTHYLWFPYLVPEDNKDLAYKASK